MFKNIRYKELQWLDGGIQKGIIRVNQNFDFNEKTTRPFKRAKIREVLSVGRVNYERLDSFIINSLNDYYTKLNLVTKAEEKRRRTNEYNELYQLWYNINVARQNRDINLNNYYDDLVYRLYLLGYKSDE